MSSPLDCSTLNPKDVMSILKDFSSLGRLHSKINFLHSCKRRGGIISPQILSTYSPNQSLCDNFSTNVIFRKSFKTIFAKLCATLSAKL